MTIKPWKSSDGRTVQVSSKKADLVLKEIDRRMARLNLEAKDLATHAYYDSASAKSHQATGLQIAFVYLLEEFKLKRR